MPSRMTDESKIWALNRDSHDEDGDTEDDDDDDGFWYPSLLEAHYAVVYGIILLKL